MKRRRLGRSGLVVSEIGMGTMPFGSMADEETSLAIVDPLDELLAAAEVRLDPAALSACDEISREIRYPMG